MTTFTIGCDPEIFLKKDGVAYSAHGVIPGTKKEPFPVKAGAIQVDGMAVEFNTDPVVLTQNGSFGDIEAFDGNVTTVMNEMLAKVKETDPALEYNIESVQEFSDETFKAMPAVAIELGCDPDFNAYTGEVNPRPDGAAVNFRTASGHIHIGWDADIPVNHPDHMEVCCSFIKYMDCTVGMFMTILDKETRRRELYGKAGAFRPKSYGVEYRTPSSLWVKTADRRAVIFHLTRIAVMAAQNEYTAAQVTTFSQEEIQTIINDGDYEKAMKALRHIQDMFYTGGVDLMSRFKFEYDQRLIAEGKKKKPAAAKKAERDALKTAYAAAAKAGKVQVQVVEPAAGFRRGAAILNFGEPAAMPVDWVVRDDF